MAVPPTFPAAVAFTLSQNGACASAFGDSAATPKFQGVKAATKVQMPYARILAVPGGSVTFESQDGAGLTHYYMRGELQVDVFTADADDAESFGDLVIAALTDALIVFANGRTLELRLSAAPFFVPEPDPGAGTAIVYHRVHQFSYLNERSITPGP